MSRRILFSIVLLLYPIGNFVSGQQQSINFKYLTVDNGLSQSWIRCMLQDKLNFMWFGTDDGLNRYDGYNFVIYKHNPRNSNTLSNSSISSICEDTKGNLWIGTSEGLNLYDRKNDLFIHPSNWPKQAILSIAEDENGNLWIGTGEGLYYYNTKNDSFIVYGTDKIKDHGKISNGRIQSILIDHNKNVWIGTFNGLNLFDKESDSFIKYTHKKENPNSLGGNDIRNIIEDQTGRLWIGNSSGLDMLAPDQKDPGKAVFIHHQYNINNRNGITEGTVLSLLEDKIKQKLWIGVENGCLNMIDLKTYKDNNNNFNCYCNDPDKTYSLSNNSVYSLFQDKQGNIWVGTWGKGINIISIAPEKFIHYNSEPYNKNSLIDNHVNTFFDDNEYLWIGTEGGLEQFNKKEKTFKHYVHNPQNKTTIGSNSIVTITKDSKGNLWSGGWNSGLNRFNYKNESFTHYYYDQKDSDINLSHIFSVCPTSDNNLWLGVIYEGLILYKPDYGIVKKYSTSNSQISNNNIEEITKTKDGDLWMSSNTSLDRFNPVTETFAHYIHNPEDPASIKSNTIFSLFEDSKENIWVGTNAGLHLLNKSTNGFKVFQVEDGLPDNSIKSICEDRHGNLWLGTNKGLSKFIDGIKNPANPVFKNYTLEDGLQGNEFSRNSSYLSPNGLMYFGGVNGFNVFNPDSIKDINNIISLVFVDFLIFNEPVTAGTKDSPIKENISQANEVVLNYTQSVFSFRFSALNYISPEKTQYAYILEGFEKKWNNVGNKREATYTNLENGVYTFRVKANNNGIWDENIASVKVIILPPWWKTWVFRLIVFIIIISSIYMAYYLRVEMYRKKQKELTVLVEKRTLELTKANEVLVERQIRIEKYTEELRQYSENLREANELLINKQKLIENQAEQLTETNLLLKGTNLQLKDINEQLGILNSTKDRFFSIIAHDLRNPFNAVSGLADLLLQNYKIMPPEEIETYLNMIYKSSTSGNNLLDNLLQWSRSQTGRISFNPSRLILFALAEETKNLVEGQAQQKNIMIRLLIDRNIAVLADENMIKTILRNLVSNAIKFSHKDGTITIESVQIDSKTEVSVTDSGVGISPENLSKLFRIDATVTTKGTADETGTGLGLILCKEFMEKHNEKIRVESEIGKGSKFIFTLQLA